MYDVTKEDSERIFKVCIHEAGHYVVAHLQNFNCGEIEVEFSISGHIGGTTTDVLVSGVDNFEKLVSFLRKRIQVLYAGVISESIDLSSEENDNEYAIDQWQNGGGKDDFSKIRELLRILRTVLYPDILGKKSADIQLEKLSNELINLTGNLVFEHLDIINKVATAMFSKVKLYDKKYVLYKDEIVKIIREGKNMINEIDKHCLENDQYGYTIPFIYKIELDRGREKSITEILEVLSNEEKKYLISYCKDLGE